MKREVVKILSKYYYIHVPTGKKYLVGAYSEQEAFRMVSRLAGDSRLMVAEVPEQYR
jgi:hypothetical protein